MNEKIETKVKDVADEILHMTDAEIRRMAENTLQAHKAFAQACFKYGMQWGVGIGVSLSLLAYIIVRVVFDIPV